MQFNRRYSNTRQTVSTTNANNNSDTSLPPLHKAGNSENKETLAPTDAVSYIKPVEEGRHKNGNNNESSSLLPRPSFTKQYREDQYVTSKPPRSPYSPRPPSRVSSRNEWATQENSETRPVSPLTRSRNHAITSESPGGGKQRLRFIDEAEEDNLHSSKSTPANRSAIIVQVKDRNQSRSGPEISATCDPADGPERLSWPPTVEGKTHLTHRSEESASSISDASQEYHRNLCHVISGFPLSYPNQEQEFSEEHRRKISKSHDNIGKGSTGVPIPCFNQLHSQAEPCAFQAYLETRKPVPIKPAQPATNLAGRASVPCQTVPIHDTTPKRTTSAINYGSRNMSRHAPFVNTEIPNEIQDDLLRVELLMELRRYKQAINTQLQAQQRMIYMCNSGCPPQIQQQQQIPQNYFPTHTTAQRHPYGRNFTRHATRSKNLMDPFKISSEDDKAQKAKEQPERSATIWDNDLANQLNAGDFMSSFHDHESRLQSGTVGGGVFPYDTSNLSGAGGETQQFPGSVSLLARGRRTDIEDFQASKSGFPSGIIADLEPEKQDVGQSENYPYPQVEVQNPLLAAAELQLQTPDFHIREIPPSQHYPEKRFSQNLQSGQTFPMQSLTHQSFLSPRVAPSFPGHVPVQSQQYQQYVMEKNQFLEKLQAYTPGGFKLMDPKRIPMQSEGMPPSSPHGQPQHEDQMVMLRKPVAVSKCRSPNNYLPPTSPQSTSTSFGSEDRHPGFTPDLLSNNIDMQLRTPEERLRTIRQTDVEELGNLLSQLPVLSRTQKVEEFAFRTLKPPSPVTEVESETSMIPLASSHGTLTSRVVSSADDRPLTEEGPYRQPGTAPPQTPDTATNNNEQREFSTVDTDKLSIHELVTLGRKIYRILSQLSTSSPNKSAPATPATGYNGSARSNPISVPNSVIKGQSRSATTAVVDFNIIPNPTFITGPGPLLKATQSRSTPRVIPSSFRSPTSTPRKSLRPPPTHWERRSGSFYDAPNPLMSQQTSRRSFDSGGARHLPRAPTKTILKWDSKPSPTPLKRDTNSYTVRTFNNENNNDEYRPFSKPSKYTRQDSAYGMHQQQSTFHEPDPNSMESSPRSRSTRRNFIQENISKVRAMRKTPQRGVRSKPLPPVSNKYENVQSVVGSNSKNRSDRSSSMTRSQSRGEVSPSRQRSTSLPPNMKNSIQAYYRSTSPSRPTSARTISSAVKSKSRESVKSNTNKQPVSTSRKVGNNNNESGPNKRGSGRVALTYRPVQVLSKTSVDEPKVSARKSRSKTRKGSAISSTDEYRGPSPSRQSPVSSSVEQVTNRLLNKSKPAIKARNGVMKKKITKEVPIKKGVPNAKMGGSGGGISGTGPGDGLGHEYYRAENHPNAPPDAYLKTSESEQELIRTMVKAEMDQMVDNYVKDVMKRAKDGNPTELQYKPPDSDLEDSIVDSDNLAPVYSPPRFHDESLFSLEKWINPDGPSPGTAEGMDLKRNRKSTTKSPTVRFNIPQQPV